MDKIEISLIIVNFIFLVTFICSAIDSYKISKNDRVELKFYRKEVHMTEKEIDDSSPPSFEKSIVKLSKSLIIASILSATVIALNIIYLFIISFKN